MTWDIELYDGGDEFDTIRGLSPARKEELLGIFDRLGVDARAFNRELTASPNGGTNED